MRKSDLAVNVAMALYKDISRHAGLVWQYLNNTKSTLNYLDFLQISACRAKEHAVVIWVTDRQTDNSWTNRLNSSVNIKTLLPIC